MRRNCWKQRLTPCELWTMPAQAHFPRQCFIRTYSCLLLTDALTVAESSCGRKYMGHRIKNSYILVCYGWSMLAAGQGHGWRDKDVWLLDSRLVQEDTIKTEHNNRNGLHLQHLIQNGVLSQRTDTEKNIWLCFSQGTQQIRSCFPDLTPSVVRNRGGWIERTWPFMAKAGLVTTTFLF